VPQSLRRAGTATICSLVTVAFMFLPPCPSDAAGSRFNQVVACVSLWVLSSQICATLWFMGIGDTMNNLQRHCLGGPCRQTQAVPTNTAIQLQLQYTLAVCTTAPNRMCIVRAVGASRVAWLWQILASV